MNPFSRLLCTLALLTLTATHSGCSDAVLIQVENRPKDTKALRLRANLDGVAVREDLHGQRPPDQHPRLLSPPPSRIFLGPNVLPAQVGELDVTVEALVDECIVASGTARARIQLPSLDWSVINVHLEPLRSKLCPVTVELYGATSGVTLTEAAHDPWDCSPEVVGYRRCQGYFPVGQTARIDLPGVPPGTLIHRSYPSASSNLVPPFELQVAEVTAPDQKARDGGPENGLVLRLLNTTLDPGYTIKGLWGTPATQRQDTISWQYERLWAVGKRPSPSGDQGFIAELGKDGTLRVVKETESPLNAIMGRSDQEIWAVGDAGTVQRWNGAQWEPKPLPTGVAKSNLSAVFVYADSGDTWIVGSGGTVLRSSDGKEALSWVPSDFIAYDNLLAVAGLMRPRRLFVSSRNEAIGDVNHYLDGSTFGYSSEPYIAAAPCEGAGKIFVSTTKGVQACPTCSFERLPERTNLWCTDPNRVWSAGDSLDYADASSDKLTFTRVEHPASARALQYPIRLGTATRNTPFHNDIWVLDRSGLLPVSTPY